MIAIFFSISDEQACLSDHVWLWTHRTASVLRTAINWVNLVQSTFYSMPYNGDHQHFTWTETP